MQIILSFRECIWLCLTQLTFYGAINAPLGSLFSDYSLRDISLLTNNPSPLCGRFTMLFYF